MKLLDQFKREENNTDKVYLTPEGLFFKAYERSAYILCTQWKPLKVTVRRVKYLNDAPIVSVGFPQTSLSAVSSVLRAVGEGVLCASHPIQETEFQAWKNQCDRDVSEESSKEQAAADVRAGIIERISCFPLESSSPLDCLLFVSELKRLVTKDYGALR